MYNNTTPYLRIQCYPFPQRNKKNTVNRSLTLTLTAIVTLTNPYSYLKSSWDGFNCPSAVSRSFYDVCNLLRQHQRWPGRLGVDRLAKTTHPHRYLFVCARRAEQHVARSICVSANECASRQAYIYTHAGRPRNVIVAAELGKRE